MSISQDPEIKCPKCSGRMYWDDFSGKEIPDWVCMDCEHVISEE